MVKAVITESGIEKLLRAEIDKVKEDKMKASPVKKEVDLTQKKVMRADIKKPSFKDYNRQFERKETKKTTQVKLIAK